MTAKASEPRTLIKVPVSIRDEIRKQARNKDMNMLQYLVSLVPKETT